MCLCVMEETKPSIGLTAGFCGVQEEDVVISDHVWAGEVC